VYSSFWNWILKLQTTCLGALGIRYDSQEFSLQEVNMLISLTTLKKERMYELVVFQIKILSQNLVFKIYSFFVVVLLVLEKRFSTRGA